MTTNTRDTSKRRQGAGKRRFPTPPDASGRPHDCVCPPDHVHKTYEGISYGYAWCTEDRCSCRRSYVPQAFIDKMAEARVITL